MALVGGGHTHSLLLDAPAPDLLLSPPVKERYAISGPYPTIVANGGKEIPVVQAQFDSRYLGVLDLTASTDFGASATGAAGRPVLLGGARSSSPVADDPAVAARVAALQVAVDAASGEVLGQNAARMEVAGSRAGETEVGDMVGDVVLAFGRARGIVAPGAAAVAMSNAGGFRAPVDAGDVTRGDVLALFPFGDWVVALELTGPEVVAALEDGLRGYGGAAIAGRGDLIHVAGLRYAFDPARPEGARVMHAVMLVGGAEIDAAAFPRRAVVLTTSCMASTSAPPRPWRASSTAASSTARRRPRPRSARQRPRRRSRPRRRPARAPPPPSAATARSARSGTWARRRRRAARPRAARAAGRSPAAARGRSARAAPASSRARRGISTSGRAPPGAGSRARAAEAGAPARRGSLVHLLL